MPHCATHGDFEGMSCPTCGAGPANPFAVSTPLRHAERAASPCPTHGPFDGASCPECHPELPMFYCEICDKVTFDSDTCAYAASHTGGSSSPFLVSREDLVSRGAESRALKQALRIEARKFLAALGDSWGFFERNITENVVKHLNQNILLCSILERFLQSTRERLEEEGRRAVSKITLVDALAIESFENFEEWRLYLLEERSYIALRYTMGKISRG